MDTKKRAAGTTRTVCFTWDPGRRWQTRCPCTLRPDGLAPIASYQYLQALQGMNEPGFNQCLTNLGFKCPVCSKSVASNEMEVHFIMCLSKPRLSYNDDVLSRDSGECVICLEELQQGDTIARLPCLCIYHKRDMNGCLFLGGTN
ncbi:hypothetical protein cypCar_00027591 [Cyprinus carpio]|nr:hypothetical protein cypCar_00027591 [Cyprinus carpio]